MTPELPVEGTRILRAFQRQVERLRRSPLLSAGRVEIRKTFNIGLTSGARAIKVSGFDPDQFQAQLPILRQFILQSDKINFLRVCNLVRANCARPELNEWVDEARRMWKTALQEVPTANEQLLFGVKTNLDDALERLFYGFGGLFHVDIDQPDEETNVKAVEEALIHSAFLQLWECLHILDSVIFWWLDDTAARVPTVAEIRRNKV